MDRIVRLYNPYIPSKPIALLKSHTTPIFFIHLCNEDNRIFTMSVDKCLNVIIFQFFKLEFFFIKKLMVLNKY